VDISPAKTLIGSNGQAPEGVILVDVSWLLHRSFHANKGQFSVMLQPEEGPAYRKDTSTFYGFLNAIVALINRRPSHAIILCVDAPTESLARKKLNPEYKAGRGEADPGIYSPLTSIQQTCCALKSCVLAYKDGEEADDHVYSLSAKLSKAFDEIIIYANDKDLCQSLAFEGVKMARSFKGKDFEYLGQDYIDAKIGPVEPALLAFYRSFIGDSSDNLKGYARFPRVHIKRLVEQFRTPAKLLEAMSNGDPCGLTSKWYEVIREDKGRNLMMNYAIMKLSELPESNLYRAPGTLKYLKAYNCNSILKAFERYELKCDD